MSDVIHRFIGTCHPVGLCGEKATTSTTDPVLVNCPSCLEKLDRREQLIRRNYIERGRYMWAALLEKLRKHPRNTDSYGSIVYRSGWEAALDAVKHELDKEST